MTIRQVKFALVLIFGHSVGERHKTISKMHIFYLKLTSVNVKVTMAEIPEPFHTQCSEYVGSFLSSFLWDAEHRNERLSFPAKLLQ